MFREIDTMEKPRIGRESGKCVLIYAIYIYRCEGNNTIIDYI